MKVIKYADKIVVEDKNFDIKSILECGQIFSFKNVNEVDFIVESMGKFAVITKFQDCTTIKTKDVDYFYNFFDFDTDYDKIRDKIINLCPFFSNLKMRQLRILRQDAYQTILSFIVSQNNNIKRIKKILFSICQNYGKYNKDFDMYSFPTLQMLSDATSEDFKKLGAGYRSEYLEKTILSLSTKDFDIENLKKLDTTTLKSKLLSLHGIGPKVADCILFFGFNRTDVFPVDTWIRKGYSLFCSEKRTDAQISKYFVDIFGELSAYAQQYLYDHMLNHNPQNT